MSEVSPEPETEPDARAETRSQSGRRLVVLLVCVAVIAGALWSAFSIQSPRDDSKSPSGRRLPPVAVRDRFQIPDIVPSRFRNATKNVHYVGNRACLECHPGEHQSYLKTTHSGSLEEVDVTREPPNGEFFHELSARHYRVYRDGKKLRLREFIRDTKGEEVVLADHVARYALGSGNYARMYLFQAGDFLIESPLTWFPRSKKWGMSAGYEKDPHQPGFGREIGWGCINCHSGRVEMVDNVDQRLRVEELAIGCERCHGPGALHVKERKARLPIRGDIDDSIVNIKHLSRERQEDVCSQCHLSALSDVDVQGRSLADYRPGLRMSDFRVSYRIKRPNSAMTVSGQIEQMRLSRCYIESKEMTCATCHNPHAVPEKSERIEYFRAKCLQCHETETCGLPVKKRIQKQPQDNCIACHMPKGPTDIPHFSFTHHRVGIHTAETTSTRYTESDQLVPVGDISHLPAHERLRMLGKAHDMFAGRLAGGVNDDLRNDPSQARLAIVYQNRARAIYEKLRERGLRDPEIDAFFTRYHWRTNYELCIANAKSALKSKQISPSTRQSTLYKLATSYIDRQQYAKALPHLEELVKIERGEMSLMLLGICHEQQGNLPEAERYVKEAIRAAPARADLHEYLAKLYRKRGKPADAERELKRARLLSRILPQPK